MSAHKLTPEQKILSEQRKKEYHKKYNLWYSKQIPIELRRIYNRQKAQNKLNGTTKIRNKLK